MDKPFLLRNLLSHSFRSVHAIDRKLPDSFRVLIVGDSYTYGHAVTDRETLPYQLQRVLNRGGRSPFIEVINAGRPGLSLFTAMTLLAQFEDWLQYDLLLFCLSRDDACPWTIHELRRLRNDAEERWRLQWLPEEEGFPHMLTVLGSVVRSQAKAERTIAVAFYDPYPRTCEIALEVLPRICRHLGVPFLDLVTPFEDFAAEQITISEVDSHPSPMAHRVAAAETAAFLESLLPGWAVSRPCTAEDSGLAQRLDLLDAVDQSQATLCHLSFRHLVDLSEAGFRFPPTIAAELDLLRQELNRLHRLLMLLRILTSTRHEIGTFCEKLFYLDRFLLLDALGVPGAGAAGPVAEQLARLSRDTAETGAEIERLMELASGPQPPRPTKDDHGKFAWSIERLLGRARSARTEEVGPAVCALLHEIGLALKQAMNLCLRYKPETGSTDEGHTRIETLIKRLRILRSWVSIGQPLAGDDHQTELIVELTLPSDLDAYHVDLVCTFTTLIPYTRQDQQICYPFRDGKPHAYRFTLPAGAGGYAETSLRSYRESQDSPNSINVEDPTNSVTLSQGPASRPYEPGSLLYSPFPRLLCPTGSPA